MLQIPEGFLESEVRSGFYIPAFMKRSWAATLTVLDEISEICARHDLKWWIDWGSLLATVRHGGFIPWDDDLDISMLRDDYMKFNRFAKEELPAGYFANNIYNNPRFDEYHTRVVNNTEIDRSEDFLNRHSGFPYLAGVDVFCIDYVSPDKETDQQICSLIYSIGSIATNLAPELFYNDVPQYRKALSDIEAICGYRFRLDKPLRQQINQLCEGLMQTTEESEAREATCMVDHATREGFRGVFPKEYYREFIYLPYEFIEVPVPLHYDEMLKTIFGNYMNPYRGGGVHEFPYFEQQERVLEENGAGKLREVYSLKIR
ncbi:MAG: LicD family protein [Lachnospiraceae bacterium]|nr:LicD family protein [Lachnospiraceae bacterium]